MSERGRRPTPPLEALHRRPSSAPIRAPAERSAPGEPSALAIRRVREFCLNLYHLAPVGYVTHRPDGHILEANHTAGCMLGVSPERLRGSPLARFAPREEQRLAAHLTTVAVAGARATLELRMERPSGTRFHASLESVLLDDDEAPTILSALVDVSEQRRLEASLLERDATLRTVFATVPGGLIGVDEHGSIRSFGAGAERMFGHRAKDVLGRHVGLLFDVTAPPVSPARTPARGVPMQRARGRRRDGGLFDAEVGVGRFAGASYTVLAVRDVSSQHALEQARGLQAAGRLATGIVQDTNDLLLRLAAGAESLSEAAGDAALVRERAAELRRMALGGAGLLRRLGGAMGADDAGELEIDVALAGMGSLIAALLGESVELEVALGAEGARVACDRGQIEQLAVNLVVNARDALPHGGRVEIETARVVHEGAPYVRFVVRDTGVGMHEAVRERAFSGGFTTKECAQGRGLDTVRTIVEQARGRVELASELGAGTCLTILLPELASAPQAPLPRARPSTLLLVERDTFVRSTLRAWLERAGHRVIEAPDAQDGLERCRERRGEIDALLTDVLPGGADLAERARELCPRMSVLFMSGSSRADLVRGGKLAPDVFLLGKPCSERELAEALCQAVGAAQPCSLLVVEDDALSRRMFGSLLAQHGYDVQLAASVGEALEHQRVSAFDVVLTDARLPDGSVGDLLRALRRDEAVPVLIFSGSDPSLDAELASVLRLPRTSFVQKPAGVEDLVRGIEALRTGSR